MPATISSKRRASLFDSIVLFMPVVLCLFGVSLCVISFFLDGGVDELIVSAIGLSIALLGMTLSVCHKVINMSGKYTNGDYEC